MDEFDALWQQAQAGHSSNGGPSTDTDSFDALWGQAHGQDWNLIDSIKQFASGAVENTGGMFGLAADLNPFQPGGPKLDFPASRTIKGLTDQVTAAPDKDYRYSRTLGGFVGPGSVFKIGRTATGLLSNIFGAFGAQGAEDITGDKTIAPLIGAGVASAAASSIPSIFSAGRALFTGASPQEIKGSAALAQKELTGLTAPQLESAIANAPDDALGSLMTTAELTDNAGMAQIEKTLSAADEPARIYAQRGALREQARDKIIDAMTPVPAVNKEALGTLLMDKGATVQTEMGKEAARLWAEVPRFEKVNVLPQQYKLKTILRERQGGLPADRRTQILVDQFMDKDLGKYRTSGMLQDIRSDALKLLRDDNLPPHDAKILSALQGQVDEAMSNGLKGESYDLWQTARQATAETAQTFDRGTAGKALVQETARPSNVLANAFKGDSQSVKELQKAVRNDPDLIDQVKRGILDRIPRDAQGRLTANKVKSYLDANEGGLKELLGTEHYGNLGRILSDLQTEAKVGEIAFKSSKGNSVTSQRGTVAGAIQDTMLGALIPGSGTLAHLAESVKRAANINNGKQVQELLFRAAMEPQVALELAKTPTNTRIFSALERIQNFIADVSSGAGRGAALELGRTQTAAPNDSIRSELKRKELGISGQGTRLSATPTPEKSELPQPGGGTNSQRENASTNLNLPIWDLPNTAKAQTQQKEPTQEYTSPNFAPSSSTTQDPLEMAFNSLNQQGNSDMAGNTYRAPPELVQALIQQESAGKPDAVSNKGARGLMQIMPETAKEIAAELGLESYDLNDLKTNQMMGEYYLNKLLDMFGGDEKLALAAYNAGMGKVQQWIDKYNTYNWDEISVNLKREGKYKETRDYVPLILNRAKKLNPDFSEA